MSLSDETIYTKHKDDLIRYATALVGPADAEDVLSTVVLRVLERRSLTDLDDARPYFRRHRRPAGRLIDQNSQRVAPYGSAVPRAKTVRGVTS